MNSVVVKPWFRQLNHSAREDWGCKVEHGHKTTGLKVLIAGIGRTGTQTIRTALNLMGYKTYGTFDAVYYLPEVYELRMPVQVAIDAFRSCRVDGFTVEPIYNLTAKLFPVSPGVKVVLTVRDFPSWAKATVSNTRFGAGYWTLRVVLAEHAKGYLCHWLPYGAIWRTLEPTRSFVGNNLQTMLLEMCVEQGFGWSVMLGNNYPDSNREFILSPPKFEEYHEAVRRMVPPEQLLEMDVKKDGFSKLSKFLGAPVPPEFAASDRLPRAGAGSAHAHEISAQTFPVRWHLFWLFLLLTVLVNWACFRMAWRLLGVALAVVGCSAREARKTN